MALDITFYGGADTITKQLSGTMISRVVYTVTGSSAVAATVPASAAFAIFTAGEATVLSTNDAAVSATNGQLIGANAQMFLGVKPGTSIYAKTA